MKSVSICTIPCMLILAIEGDQPDFFTSYAFYLQFHPFAFVGNQTKLAVLLLGRRLMKICVGGVLPFNQWAGWHCMAEEEQTGLGGGESLEDDNLQGLRVFSVKRNKKSQEKNGEIHSCKSKPF